MLKLNPSNIEVEEK